MDERIVHLEEKVAFLEKALDELNEVVYELSRNQDGMTRELRDVRAQGSPTDPNRKPADEVPPHYGDIR